MSDDYKIYVDATQPATLRTRVYGAPDQPTKSGPKAGVTPSRNKKYQGSITAC
jgi:hypothetical protein